MGTKRTAIVTGAATGIGAAAAIALSAEGLNVVINYIDNQELARQVEKKCRENGSLAIIRKWDVSDFDACQAAVKEIAENFGAPDVLVNNAGITRDRTLLKMTESEFDTVIKVNLKSVFNMCKACVPYMVEKNYGKIVSMSSSSGINGNPGQVNYSASKAGIIGITYTLAKELGKYNITVNALAPSIINTSMIEKIPPNIMEGMLSKQPLKRLGNPDEVAKAIVFFSTDRSSYITGQVMKFS